MRVRPSLPLFALLAAATGCQVVFGIDAYEERSSSGTGAGGAGGESGGGGQAGGTTSSGIGGDDSECACVGEAWRPFAVEGAGAPTDGAPTTCANGGELLLLFDGAPEVSCAGCGCDASGCDLPALDCFANESCSGTPVYTGSPGSGCASLGGGIDSCKLAAPVGAPSCTGTGGEPVDPGVTFSTFHAFCSEPGCGAQAGCVRPGVDCIVADGIVGGACPAGFPERYELAASGAPSCPECTCVGSCEGVPYRLSGDGLFCSFPIDVSLTDCSFSQLGGEEFGSKGDLHPTCEPGMPSGHPGSFDVEDVRTVCCRDALAGVGGGPG